MRQKSTVIASSRRGSEWVCWVWAIRGSFRRGFGWPPLYSQSTQHTSSVSVRSATLLLLRTLIPCVVASVVTSEFLSKELFVVTFLRCFRQVRGTARASFLAQLICSSPVSKTLTLPPCGSARRLLSSPAPMASH